MTFATALYLATLAALAGGWASFARAVQLFDGGYYERGTRFADVGLALWAIGFVLLCAGLGAG